MKESVKNILNNIPDYIKNIAEKHAEDLLNQELLRHNSFQAESCISVLPEAFGSKFWKNGKPLSEEEYNKLFNIWLIKNES